MIFLAKGTCTLGRVSRDKDGNIIEQTPAKFEAGQDGGCIAVGILNDETMDQVGQAELFGDFDPWGYLSHALKLLAPTRSGNIPDFEGIFKNLHAARENCECDFLPYYCRPDCRDCIVRAWMDEMEGEE